MKHNGTRNGAYTGTDTRTNTEKDTGLLTRFVPNKLKTSAFYRWFLRLTRVLQFLSAIISLAIFSSRVYKIYRLVNNVKTRRGISHSFGAVEGILAAAVLYTLIAMLFACIKRNSSPGTARWLRWLWVVLDLAFVGAFIAVADLTRPNGGPAGPRHCYTGSVTSNAKNANGNQASTDKTCQLPWGTFILAIFSTLLHAITAAFHEAKDHRRRNRSDHAFVEQDKAFQRNGRYEYGDKPNSHMEHGHAGRGHTNQAHMEQENLNNGHMNDGNMDQGYMNQGNMDQGNMDQGHIDQGYMNQGRMDQGYMNQGRMDQGYMNQGHLEQGRRG